MFTGNTISDAESSPFANSGDEMTGGSNLETSRAIFYRIYVVLLIIMTFIPDEVGLKEECPVLCVSCIEQGFSSFWLHPELRLL